MVRRRYRHDIESEADQRYEAELELRLRDAEVEKLRDTLGDLLTRWERRVFTHALEEREHKELSSEERRDLVAQSIDARLMRKGRVVRDEVDEIEGEFRNHGLILFFKVSAQGEIEPDFWLQEAPSCVRVLDPAADVLVVEVDPLQFKNRRMGDFEREMDFVDRARSLLSHFTDRVRPPLSLEKPKQPSGQQLQREVQAFILFYEKGMKWSEIGRRLKCDGRTAKRGVERLVDRLGWSMPKPHQRHPQAPQEFCDQCPNGDRRCCRRWQEMLRRMDRELPPEFGSHPRQLVSLDQAERTLLEQDGRIPRQRRRSPSADQ